MTSTLDEAGTLTIKNATLRAPRQPTSIKWWAGLGALFVAFQAYLYTRWVFSGNFSRVSSGPDPIPLWMRVFAHTFEVVSLILVVWGLHRYVYRPWRKDRRIPALGMMWLASPTIYWLDWLINWGQQGGNWSGAFWVNMGSWYNFIPGWIAPNGEKVYELSSIGIPVVIVWIGLFSVAICAVLRKVSSRWPNMGKVGLVGIAIAFSAVLDLVAEIVLIRTGMWTYGGAIPSLTLWSGHYYQFPLYETAILAPVMGFMGAIVYFTDDRGRTVVERGIDRIHASKRQKGWLRFLAFAGALNLLLFLYSVIWGLFTLQPGFQWTKDVVDRSYFRGGICGEGTKFACPAEGLPIPRGSKGFYVAPNGDLIMHEKVVGHVELKYR